MNLQTQGEEGARLRRHGADQAIALALESKWEEAVAVNRSILASFPSDVDSWNRLGKAMLELGRFREAREAYSKSLEFDPINSIARRNLERLAAVKEDEEVRRPEAVAKVAQDLFIEELGKTGTTVLQDVQPDLLARVVAGDEVYLKATEDELLVENAQGEVLGPIERKLGLRLLRLMERGSKYAAAIKSVSENLAEVIIKETYRDPSQTRVSFPAIAEAIRPYTRESLLRYGIDEEEEEPEEEHEAEDWDSEGETSDSRTVSLSSLKESLDIEDEEEEE